MAEERRFVSLCDRDLILHLSLSNFGSAYAESDHDAIDEDDDFVFDIDPTVLVDTRKLIIDEPIAEGLHSIVYKGWWVFQLQNLIFIKSLCLFLRLLLCFCTLFG